jgi:methylmalonyl-CoA mutase cobalamin-binding domain/chain
LAVIEKGLQDGAKADDILFKVVIPSLEVMISSLISPAEINLAQYFMSSQIASEATEILISKFEQSQPIKGCVVIGTSQGDFHGLGKRIIIGCLKAYFIDVVDLGLNVAPQRFVDEAIKHNAQVVGISSMMLHTARGENGCLKVREILKQRNLENNIKIIVGGAPYRYDSNLYNIVGADAWSENGIEAAKEIIQLIKEVKKG